jgi:hypothetical protein
LLDVIVNFAKFLHRFLLRCYFPFLTIYLLQCGVGGGGGSVLAVVVVGEVAGLGDSIFLC